MSTTLSTLEALLLKATYRTLPKLDDEAVEGFCFTMRDNADGPQLAAQVLAARIHSLHTREAMYALEMLDRCLRFGNYAFQAEIGKFRFLNEMIKLVSPKYFASRTAPEVRQKVLQLLGKWAVEYPRDSKFHAAFEMLKNQGVVKEEDLLLDEDKNRKPSIFEDEEKSKLIGNLLHSNKPEDIQHANRLIKSMVREDEKLTQARTRRDQDISSSLNSAGLLRDMLQRSADASKEEKQLMKELDASCRRQHDVLRNLASLDSAANCDLEDILNACDILDEVTAEYNLFVAEINKKANARQKYTDTDDKEDGTLLDFAGADKPPTKNTMEELSAIFSATANLPDAEPLKPVAVLRTDEKAVQEKGIKGEGWNELDCIGEELLKMSLPENARRVDGFNGKSSAKIPMNALDKATDNKNSHILDLDFFTKNTAQPINNNKINYNSNDDVMTIEKPDNKKSEVKSLTDIDITFDKVKPGRMAPKTVFEEDCGISVVLHFCKDKPRHDVYVIVISSTSKNTSPIEDYKIQFAASKGCKTRLLPPSGDSLPPYSPFLPPPALSQVLLLGAPPSRPRVALHYVISYTCDQETYTEMGELRDLNLNDI